MLALSLAPDPSKIAAPHTHTQMWSCVSPYKNSIPTYHTRFALFAASLPPPLVLNVSLTVSTDGRSFVESRHGISQLIGRAVHRGTKSVYSMNHSFSSLSPHKELDQGPSPTHIASHVAQTSWRPAEDIGYHDQGQP